MEMNLIFTLWYFSHAEKLWHPLHMELVVTQNVFGWAGEKRKPVIVGNRIQSINQ
jgi:hypothetical protein